MGSIWAPTALGLMVEPFPRSVRTSATLMVATTATDRMCRRGLEQLGNYFYIGECAFAIGSAGGMNVLMQNIIPPPPPHPVAVPFNFVQPITALNSGIFFLLLLVIYNFPIDPATFELLTATLLAIANCSTICMLSTCVL